MSFERIQSRRGIASRSLKAGLCTSTTGRQFHSNVNAGMMLSGSSSSEDVFQGTLQRDPSSSRVTFAQKPFFRCFESTKLQHAAVLVHIVVAAHIACTLPREPFWAKCVASGRIMSAFTAMTARHTPFLLPFVTTFPNTSLSFIPDFALLPSLVAGRAFAVPFVLPAFAFASWSAAAIGWPRPPHR